MLRRHFIAQTGLAGAVVLPSLPSIAQNVAMQEPSLQWSLLSEAKTGECAASLPCYAGTVRIQVRPDQAIAGIQASSRLWFQTDEGTAAYELASFASNGRSQSLWLTADAERLLALECTCGTEGGQAAQQLLLSQGGLGHLGLGRHWLVLHAADQAPQSATDSGVVARIQLNVQAV